MRFTFDQTCICNVLNRANNAYKIYWFCTFIWNTDTFHLLQHQGMINAACKYIHIMQVMYSRSNCLRTREYLFCRNKLYTHNVGSLHLIVIHVLWRNRLCITKTKYRLSSAKIYKHLDTDKFTLTQSSTTYAHTYIQICITTHNFTDL